MTDFKHGDKVRVQIDFVGTVRQGKSLVITADNDTSFDLPTLHVADLEAYEGATLALVERPFKPGDLVRSKAEPSRFYLLGETTYHSLYADQTWTYDGLPPHGDIRAFETSRYEIVEVP